MEQYLCEKLQQHQRMTDEEWFSISIEISQLLNSTLEQNKISARNLIIRVLDNWNKVSEGYRQIFVDLISAAGFYPYVHSLDLPINDFGEEIRMALHKAPNLENKYFHSEQKELDDLIKAHTNVIVSAPTSFGKSMLIEEIVASGEYQNIVVIQPTLALLDETRRKLRKYSEHYKIIVKTTQEAANDKGNVFLLTAERVLEYPNMPQIDLLILDEFYKLSNKRGDNRNNVLNTAFIRIMKNPNCRFYLLGPNIDAIPEGFIDKYRAVFYKTDFSMVITETEDKFGSVNVKKGGKICEEDLFSLLDSLSEQTLIFCSSPNTARKLAFSYCEHLIEKGIGANPGLPLVDWINDNLSCRWSLAKCLQYSIGVHDGSMPKHITSSTIQYFNDRKITFLFCTNTIIEGVNTSAKNVVYYDNKIGNKKIDYFDYSNIRGRAGRLMEHYVGKIINLREPPRKTNTVVDFPFFDQNPIASEVLVNLNETEIKDINDNIQRYKIFKEKDEELQELLIRNAISIEGQEAILKQLFTDLSIPSKRRLIIWSQIDGSLYERLNYIFDLCWENLSTEEERQSFGPKGWVVNKIVGSCYQSTVNDMIEKDLKYRAKKLAEEKKVPYCSVDQMFAMFPSEMQERADNIIERIFALQKNWLQYRAPKWINVVDSLQKYATHKLNLSCGDYAYVAEMIENEFIQSGFRILLEFGIPKSAVQKIQVLFELHHFASKNTTEDEVLSLISSKKSFLQKYMSTYEMDVINRAI